MIFWPGIAAPVNVAVSSAASLQASKAARAANRATEDSAVLEQRLERLALVTEALWTLLQERVGIEEKELFDRVHALDMSDGFLDGKIRRGATPCPACNRPVSTRNLRCLYCGTEMRHPPFAT